jgi:hypothetical protein
MNDLIERLRESAELWANEVSTRKAAADALEAQAKRIEELVAERDAAVADAERLTYLEGDEMKRVFKIGKTWYWKQEYGQPHRKAKTLRAAIDTARAALKEKQ